jgi:pantothenate kinase-related protein Tda10
MTNTTWKQQFEYDFRTKVFKGMSREEITQEAVEYFTRFFEKEIKMARNDMKQRIQYLIDDNDDYIHFIEQFKQL